MHTLVYLVNRRAEDKPSAVSSNLSKPALSKYDTSTSRDDVKKVAHALTTRPTKQSKRCPWVIGIADTVEAGPPIP